MNNIHYSDLIAAARTYIREEPANADTPMQVADLMRPLVQQEEQENFYVILLDTKNKVKDIQRVALGLVDRSHIHPREIFRYAIQHAASRVVLCHNHPSGYTNPSGEDIKCTRELHNAGEIIGIEVVDHVIIGKRSPDQSQDYLSMRREDLLTEPKEDKK